MAKTIRQAARDREPLGGADAQCLEHALTQAENRAAQLRELLSVARRAHVRTVFGGGDTAVVHGNYGVDGGPTHTVKVYSPRDVAVLWWGAAEAEILYPTKIEE